MIDWFAHRYRLARLQIERRSISRFHSKLYRKAKQQKKNEEELHLLESAEQHDVETNEDKIARLQSTYLRSKAERLLLPVPEFSPRSEKWEMFRHHEHYRLTRGAMLELRAAIRAEQKERSELVRSWLTGLTGALGALAGVLAVILGRH